jgi:hypothetical protein
MCCEDSPAAPAPQDNKFTDALADIATSNEQRAKSVFWPLEDQAVAAVQKFQGSDWKNQQIGKASADVARGFGVARANTEANDSSLGINPNDGLHSFVERGLTIGQAGADAAATTGARERADITGFDTLVGMAGRGDAKMNIGTAAAQAGGNQYVGLQRNALEQQQQDNSGMAGIGALAGTALGYWASTGFAPFSSKTLKTDKRPFRAGLAAVRKMPVEAWKYKRGAAGGMTIDGNAVHLPDDGAEHVGPYAEDFQNATGTGDGKTINTGDALGVTMAAVKELDKKVSKLEGAKA